MRKEGNRSRSEAPASIQAAVDEGGDPRRVPEGKVGEIRGGVALARECGLALPMVLNCDLRQQVLKCETCVLIVSQDRGGKIPFKN